MTHHAEFPTLPELRALGVVRSYASAAENDRRVRAFAKEWQAQREGGAEVMRERQRGRTYRAMIAVVVLVCGALAGCHVLDGFSGNDGRVHPAGYNPAPAAAPVPAAPETPRDPALRYT